MSIGRVFHSVYTLIFHTPTDLPLHAGTEDLLLLVDVYYLVWLAGGKPWFSMLVKTTSRQINLHVSCPWSCRVCRSCRWLPLFFRVVGTTPTGSS